MKKFRLMTFLPILLRGKLYWVSAEFHDRIRVITCSFFWARGKVDALNHFWCGGVSHFSSFATSFFSARPLYPTCHLPYLLDLVPCKLDKER